MDHHPPQIIETFQDLLHRANEPNRLFAQLLHQAGETNLEPSMVATILEALQEASTARTNAAFRVVEEQIGVITFDGVPEPEILDSETSRVTAVLERPKKSK